MKGLLTYYLILFFSIVLTAQKDLEKETIYILPESELVIAGSTNVNNFECKFNIQLICEPKNFSYSLEEENIIFRNLDLKLLTEGFDCGNKRMNADFQDLLMNENHPMIIIQVKRVELISSEYAKAFIKVTLAGKNKNYELPVHLNEEHFMGKFKINIRDFGLEPPTKALGLIEVDEMIEVQFNLKVRELL
ncbi:YceI family protein [Christiangramia sp. SM2212]|uniref:YceI family protein n=1 Tax=Christiangramia sediminicola TaxID=3073267 RepID=A0ABU1EUR4_9FLAO|nr:YceI family protein [Christiangramia sp. SM2212]MDR5591923.1 YceI family protein [Christiangramia sp. SM2212]